MEWTAVKVFSATKARERSDLGRQVTEWIEAERPKVVDTVVRQSSDREFHCLTIILFYKPRSQL